MYRNSTPDKWKLLSISQKQICRSKNLSYFDVSSVKEDFMLAFIEFLSHSLTLYGMIDHNVDIFIRYSNESPREGLTSPCVARC